MKAVKRKQVVPPMLNEPSEKGGGLSMGDGKAPTDELGLGTVLNNGSEVQLNIS